MNAKFKILFSDKITSSNIMLSSFLLVISGGTLAVVFHALPPLIPFYNQMPWGIARIGTNFSIFIPFSITFIIFSLNLFLAANLYEKYTLVARMITIVSLFATTLFLLFLVRTLIVVFY